MFIDIVSPINTRVSEGSTYITVEVAALDGIVADIKNRYVNTVNKIIFLSIFINFSLRLIYINKRGELQIQ